MTKTTHPKFFSRPKSGRKNTQRVDRTQGFALWARKMRAFGKNERFNALQSFASNPTLVGLRGAGFATCAGALLN
jgi:hypothetical protein